MKQSVFAVALIATALVTGSHPAAQQPRALGPGVQEGTPLVYNGVMYFPNPLDFIQALDARTGDLQWEYRRQLPEDLNKFIPFPAINRNWPSTATRSSTTAPTTT